MNGRDGKSAEQVIILRWGWSSWAIQSRRRFITRDNLL